MTRLGRLGVSHEHTWTEFPSLDGTRRGCSCGRIEERERTGWRVILSGQKTEHCVEVAARHLKAGDLVDLGPGRHYEAGDVGIRIVFAHGGRITFKADDVVTVRRYD